MSGSPSEPFSWSFAFYAAIEVGMVQASPTVCTAHRGQHAFYLDDCVGFRTPGIARPAFRSATCDRCTIAVTYVRPAGAHRWLGPFGDRSGDLHVHPAPPEPPPIQVTIDCQHQAQQPRPTRQVAVPKRRPTADDPMPEPPPEADADRERRARLDRPAKLQIGGRAYPRPSADPPIPRREEPPP